jgi:phospholipid transport system substrate-binding protein
MRSWSAVVRSPSAVDKWRSAIARVSCVALALGAAAAASAWADAPNPNTADPAQLVQQVAENFMQDLQKNRQQYRSDSNALRQLVDKDLTPYFDLEYAARLVLGRHARTITDDQRQRFLQAFEQSMLTNYGKALADFQSNRLKVLPTKIDPAATSAIVRSEIHKDDGTSTGVEYALHKTPQGWKAWDVIIEGISYVKSFRDDFGAQIDQQGIDKVIERLQSGERPASIIKSQSDVKTH